MDAPPAGEQIHMPAPSLLPILNAAGIALARRRHHDRRWSLVIGGGLLCPRRRGARRIRATSRELRSPRAARASTAHHSSVSRGAPPAGARPPARASGAAGLRAAPAAALRHVADRAVVGPAAHDVAHRQDAGDLAAVDHDEVAEAAADHRDGGLLERPVGRGEHEVAGQVVGDVLRVGVLARGRSRSGRRAP